MSNVSAMAARRTRRNAHDDERYAKLLSLLAGAGVDETPLGVYLVEEWLPRHQLDVEPTTFRTAEDAVYNFIVPQLGEISGTHRSPKDSRSGRQRGRAVPCRPDRRSPAAH